MGGKEKGREVGKLTQTLSYPVGECKASTHNQEMEAWRDIDHLRQGTGETLITCGRAVSKAASFCRKGVWGFSHWHLCTFRGRCFSEHAQCNVIGQEGKSYIFLGMLSLK